MAGKKWTDEEIELLKNNCKGKTYKELRILFPNRSKSAIETKCQMLKLNKYIIDGKYSWSDEENQKLITNYPILNQKELENLFPNKTSRAISAQARRFNLYKTKDVYNKIKKDNSHSSNLYWDSNKTEKLIKHFNQYDINGIYDIFSEHSCTFINTKLSELNLRLTDYDKIKFMIDDVKSPTLNDTIKIYKYILSGKIEGFNFVNINKYQIIMCFKYYLMKYNIKYNRNDWLSVCFGKLTDDIKLKSLIKKHFGSYYNFICMCFPNYNFKQWEFEVLDVPNYYWDNKNNRNQCYKFGIENLIKDGFINDESEILSINNMVRREYFNPTLVSKYGINDIIKYLKSKNITPKEYSQKFLFNNILFDSMEEKDLYIFIKGLKLNIIKNIRSNKFYNDIYNENYIPDFIIKWFDKNIIVEYFGLYRDNNNNSNILKKYYNKTKRKITFYNNLDNYLFLPMYPDDLKNNFKGVRNKLTSFFMSNLNIDITKFERGEIVGCAS